MADELQSGEYITFVRQGGIPCGWCVLAAFTCGSHPLAVERSHWIIRGIPIRVDMSAFTEEIKEQIGY